jgi:hypothetical protein
MGHIVIDPKSTSEHTLPTGERGWSRPRSTGRRLLSYFLVGWAGAIVMLAIGDYQLYHRLPTLSQFVTYVLIGIVPAPVFAVAGWLTSARARRRLQQSWERSKR